MTHRDQLLKPTADVIIAALQRTCDLIEQGHCKGQAHTVVDDADLWDITGALAKVCSTVVTYTELEPVITPDGVGTVERRGIIPGKTIFEAAVAALKIAMSPRWSGKLAEFNDASSTDAVVNLVSRAIGIVQRSAA